MKKTNLNVTTAVIRLNNKPYLHTHRGHYAWDIMFENYLPATIENLAWLYMGDTLPQARRTLRTMKKIFADNGISDGDRVPILYDEDGVIAIGRSEHDCWIHVRDSFVAKSFNELLLEIGSLTVVCND